MESDKRYEKLQLYQSITRQKAQHYLKIYDYITYIIIMLSCFSAFFNGGIIQFVCSFLSLIFLFISNAVRNSALRIHEKSREATKHLLLYTSLGWNLDQLDYEELFDDLNIIKKFYNSSINYNYYNCNEDLGVERFAYEFSESLFYTNFIYKRSHEIENKKLYVQSVLTIILIISVFFINDNDIKLILMSQIVTILSMVVYQRYELCYNIERTCNRLNILDNRVHFLIMNKLYTTEKLLVLYFQYITFTRESLPVSTKIYKKYNDVLKELWIDRYNNYKEHKGF